MRHPFWFVDSDAICLAQSNRGFHDGETLVERIAQPFKQHILYNFREITVIFYNAYTSNVSMNEGRSCRSIIMTPQALDTCCSITKTWARGSTVPIQNNRDSTRVFPACNPWLLCTNPMAPLVSSNMADPSVGLLDRYACSGGDTQWHCRFTLKWILLTGC